MSEFKRDIELSDILIKLEFEEMFLMASESSSMNPLSNKLNKKEFTIYEFEKLRFELSRLRNSKFISVNVEFEIIKFDNVFT